MRRSRRGARAARRGGRRGGGGGAPPAGLCTPAPSPCLHSSRCCLNWSVAPGTKPPRKAHAPRPLPPRGRAPPCAPGRGAARHTSQPAPSPPPPQGRAPCPPIGGAALHVPGQQRGKSRAAAPSAARACSRRPPPPAARASARSRGRGPRRRARGAYLLRWRIFRRLRLRRRMRFLRHCGGRGRWWGAGAVRRVARARASGRRRRAPCPRARPAAAGGSDGTPRRRAACQQAAPPPGALLARARSAQITRARRPPGRCGPDAPRRPARPGDGAAALVQPRRLSGVGGRAAPLAGHHCCRPGAGGRRRRPAGRRAASHGCCPSPGGRGHPLPAPARRCRPGHAGRGASPHLGTHGCELLVTGVMKEGGAGASKPQGAAHG